MESGWFYVALFLAIGVARPLFWLCTLTVSLWIGYRVLPAHWGRVLFGPYWKERHHTRLLQRRRDASAAYRLKRFRALSR